MKISVKFQKIFEKFQFYRNGFFRKVHSYRNMFETKSRDELSFLAIKNLC